MLKYSFLSRRLIVLVGWFLSLWAGFSLIPAKATDNASQTTTVNCTVLINEFMSARQRVIADEDGDHEDWIELYNCTNQPINLEGWALSDRYDRPEQWRFPAVEIPAQGFLLVWASGKDRNDFSNDQALHTNFRIAASGEPLLLSDADGRLIDEIPPLALGAHEVAGRHPDGDPHVSILADASPLDSNRMVIAPAWIDPPTFSHDSGFYGKEFKLQLSHPDPEVSIYYTLDGSEPDPDNLEGSSYKYKNSYQQPPQEEGQPVVIKDNFLYNEYRTHPYKKAIPIRDRRWEPDRISQISTTFDEQPDYFPQPIEADHWVNDVVYQVNRVIKEFNRGIRRLNKLGNRAIRKYYKITTGEVRPLGNRRFVAYVPEIHYRKYEYSFKGTPVRAIAVKNTEGRITTSAIATNTYFIGEQKQFDLPIIAITVPEKDLFDYDDGIFVAGRLHDEWVAIQDGDKISPYQRPVNWKERMDVAGSFEFFEVEPEGKDFYLKKATYRVHGNASRASNLKSIRVYPQYSATGDEIETDVFKDGSIIGPGRLILRNSGNQVHDYRKTYFADAYRQTIMEGLAFGVQRYRPAVVFLNGEYNGIMNIRDRLDKFYLKNVYDVEADKIDLLKKNKEVQHGGRELWDRFEKDLNEELNDDSYFQKLKKFFDEESFTDYIAAQVFIQNIDWPGNNIRYWRFQNESWEQGNPYHPEDGRWRWIMYDTDASSKDVNYNMLEYAASPEATTNYNPPWSTYVFRRLLLNDRYRNYFITRFADLLNSFWGSNRTLGILKQLKENISNEMPRHIQRWGTHSDLQQWERYVNELSEFMEKRPAIQRQHLQEFFNLGDLYQLRIKVQLEEGGQFLSADKAAIIQLNTLSLGVTDDELEKPVAASARATNMEKYLALPWSGEYFSGMPIQLSVQPRSGYQFSHWQGDAVPESLRQNPKLTLTPQANTTVTAVMVKAQGAAP